MQFASVPLTGFAQGFITIISYNYGHGEQTAGERLFRIVLIVMFSFNLIPAIHDLIPQPWPPAFTGDEVDRYRPLGHAHLLGGYDDFGPQRLARICS